VFNGLTPDKLVIIAIVALFVLGPERLPHYATQLARLVKSVREMANGARDRMREELGDDFDDLDWKKLDPRQYDPRRIIREALLDDEPGGPVVRPAAPRQSVERRKALDAGLPAPFDAEST
jgi:sec-independent protein translocase protein TatB